MRRSSPGVLGAEELVDPRVARAERVGPSEVIRVLEPLITEERRSRLERVLAQRLGSVAVLLDGPYDPHNGAAVVRSCEAFGVQRLHVVERPGTPFVVARSVSRGAQKWIDVVCHARASSAIAWAGSARLPLVAAHPEGELAPEDLGRMPRVGVVLGNEREGIRDEVARACSARVRVPMRGFVESLNVSVTAAILLHAATRDRPGDLEDAERVRLYARGLVLSVPRALDILAASSPAF
jgi:tRNA (guanosine-2'-O-)-methyltransferase